jgi:ubiquinone/menaquinone biosynthesis C-methylase UbiE
MHRSPTISQKLLSFLLRFFFYLIYNPLAWTYDAVAATVSVGMWKGWVFSTLPYINGPRVLEIGHGPGHLLAALWKQNQPGGQVFGLDFSRRMGRLARNRLRKLGFRPDLVNGKGQNLPFASSSLDQVVATFPTEYIYSQDTLKEVHRVLTPGGGFIVLPGAWITGKSLPDRLAAGLFRITGQAPKRDKKVFTPTPLIEAGFHVEIRQVQLPRSLVYIILAIKE